MDYDQIAPGFYCYGLVGGANWSPDGRRFSYSCFTKGGDYLLISGRPPLALGPASAGTPYWSPDGTWIMVNGRRISANGTRPDTVLSLLSIGWTPDNRILTLGPSWRPCGTGVFTVSASGGQLTRLLGPEYDYATVSPDGKKLLARRCSPSVAIELMDADGTNVTWTMPGADWAAWRP